jgi:uncharacterized membrane protein YqhA
MILILLNIVTILFWGYILNYLLKLEKIGCECSKGWQRTFITYFVVYLLIMLLLSTFKLWNKTQLPPLVLTVHFVLNIFFFITVYQYIHRLKKEKCECSANKARDILEIVNYVELAIVAITLFMIIYGVFFVSHYTKRNKK